MKELSEAANFCRDTFGGELPPELRGQIVARMTRARRRARFANGTRIVAVAALILFGAVMLHRPARQPVSVAVVRPNENLSLPSGKVRTIRFTGMVRTVPFSEQFVVRSAPTTVAIVHSDGPHGYEEISEDQMFRLLEGWSIALVKVNGVAELEILTR